MHGPAGRAPLSYYDAPKRQRPDPGLQRVYHGDPHAARRAVADEGRARALAGTSRPPPPPLEPGGGRASPGRWGKLRPRRQPFGPPRGVAEGGGRFAEPRIYSGLQTCIIRGSIYIEIFISIASSLAHGTGWLKSRAQASNAMSLNHGDNDNDSDNDASRWIPGGQQKGLHLYVPLESWNSRASCIPCPIYAPLLPFSTSARDVLRAAAWSRAKRGKRASADARSPLAAFTPLKKESMAATGNVDSRSSPRSPIGVAGFTATRRAASASSSPADRDSSEGAREGAEAGRVGSARGAGGQGGGGPDLARPPRVRSLVPPTTTTFAAGPGDASGESPPGEGGAGASALSIASSAPLVDVVEAASESDSESISCRASRISTMA